MNFPILPLLFLDCLANVLIGSHKFNETLSGTAARVRKNKQPYFWWTANVIDWLALKLFGTEDHCNKQMQDEAAYGGAWQAWKH